MASISEPAVGVQRCVSVLPITGSPDLPRDVDTDQPNLGGFLLSYLTLERPS